MNRLLKITAQAVAALIILYIITMILLHIFIQTDNFKPIITDFFHEKTGQTLKIDGDIKLSLFPWPGIKASHITLENPKGFQAPKNARYLAKIGKLEVRLKLADLFHGNIQPTNILLNKVNINLITSKSGKTNWGNFLNPKKPLPSNKTTATPVSFTKEENKTAPHKIMTTETLPVIQISQSNLHFINHQTGQKTDITDFSLRSPASREPGQRPIILSCQVHHHANPKIRVGLKLSTLISTNPEQSVIQLKKLNIVTQWHQLKHTLKQPIILIMKGKLSIHNNDFNTAMQGNFSESEGSFQLNATRQNGQIKSVLNVKDLFLTPLVEMLTGKPWMDGTLNASTQLSTRGKSFDHWINNMSGQGNLKVTDGKIHGLALNKMLANTLSQLITRQKPKNNDETFTPFQQMSLNYTIQKGILNCNNFLLDADQITATGKGKVNLPNARINATLLANYKKNPKWQIPLKITGSLFNPVIRPDAKNILNKLLKSDSPNNLGKDLGRMWKNISAF